MSATRATGALVASTGIAAALGYVWTIAIGRVIPPAEYADFSAGVAIAYFAVIALSPLGQTVTYFTATLDGERAAAMRWRVLRFVFAAGAVLLALSAVAAVPLARALRLREPVDIVFIAAAVVIVGALHARRGVQLGEQRFGSYSFNITLEAVVRLAVAFALLAMWPRATSGLASYACSLAVATFAAGGWPRRHGGDVDTRAVVRYFVPALVYTAIYAAFQNIDVVFVKRLFPPAEAGGYGAASLLARAAGMVVMPFYAIAVPQFIEAGDNHAELRRRFVRICLQYSALAAVAVAAFGIAGDRIDTLLFGRAYASAAPLLLPLSGAIALSGLIFLMCQLPVARNRFAFISAYAAGLAFEVVLLALMHGTLREVTLALVAANAVTLALILPFVRSSL